MLYRISFASIIYCMSTVYLTCKGHHVVDGFSGKAGIDSQASTRLKILFKQNAGAALLLPLAQAKPTYIYKSEDWPVISNYPLLVPLKFHMLSIYYQNYQIQKIRLSIRLAIQLIEQDIKKLSTVNQFNCSVTHSVAANDWACRASCERSKVIFHGMHFESQPQHFTPTQYIHKCIPQQRALHRLCPTGLDFKWVSLGMTSAMQCNYRLSSKS